MGIDSGWTLETLMAHLEALEVEREKALQVQTAELARRLETLNHAHEEAQRVLNTYLPRETYEAWLKEYTVRHEKLDAEVRMVAAQTREAEAAARSSDATNGRNLALATLVLGVIVLLANGQIF